MNPSDETLMIRAIEQAEQCRPIADRIPKVGAVIAVGDTVIGMGHRGTGQPGDDDHAEMVALRGVPALRVLEMQEDALRPRPTPYFDLTSRYDLLQLRVKNLGAGVAYNVRLTWMKHPVDHTGDEVRSLDQIAILLPQESVSVLVGAAHDTVRRFSDARFEGQCQYKDSTGKKFCEEFVCSVDASRKQLVHDNEMPKTLRELQDIPKELARIADQLGNLMSRSEDD